MSAVNKFLALQFSHRQSRTCYPQFIPKSRSTKYCSRGALSSRLARNFATKSYTEIRDPEDASKQFTIPAYPPRPRPNVADLIIFEDFDFFFVNKPPDVATGGLSQAEKNTGDFNFHDIVREYSIEKYKHVAAQLHRLDRPTSGIIVYAKNKDAERYFQGVLQNEHEKINKVYLAMVHNKPETDSGVIRGGIAKTKNRTRYSIVKRGGDPIQTDFQVLETLAHPKLGQCSLLAMRLITGRQHQARASAAALSCPIVGDGRYGGKAFPRTLLHASFIGFAARVGKPYAIRCAPDWNDIDPLLPTGEAYLELCQPPSLKSALTKQ